MGKYQRFEEIPVWQEADRLYQRVLDVVEEANTPLTATFRNQLERAALCVSNCVAEAHEGVAPGDVVSLLTSARGAAAELQSMISIMSERPKAARLRDPLQQVRTSADSCFRQLGAWRYAIENPGQNRRPAPEGQGAGQSPGGAASGARSPTGNNAERGGAKAKA